MPSKTHPSWYALDALELLSQVRDVVFRVDRLRRWVYLSPSWEALSGDTVDATVGSDCMGAVHPADRPTHAAQIQRLLGGDLDGVFQTVHLLRRGDEPRLVEFEARLIRDEEGHPAGFSGTLRDITRRAAAEEEARRRTEEVGVLHDLAARIAGTENVAEILPTALDALDRLLGVNRSAVLLVGPDGHARVHAVRGVPPAVRTALDGFHPWVPGGEPSPEAALAALGGVLARDVLRLLAMLPLLQGDKAVGTLVLFRPAGDPPLAQRDVAVCSTVAHHVSLAVERSRALARLLDQSRREAALRTLLGLALEASSVQDFLERGLDAVLAVPGLGVQPRGAIFLVDPDQNTLVLRAQRGLAENVQRDCQRLPLGRCLCGRVAQSGQTLTSSSRDPLHELHPDDPPHGHLIAPIVVGSRVLGVVNLYLDHRADTSPDRAFVEVLCRALATALERLHAEETIARERGMLLGGPVVAFRWSNDEGRTIEYVSPNIEQWGFTAAALVKGRVKFTDLVDPADGLLPGSEPPTEGAFRQHTYRLVCPDGHTRWVDDHTTAHRDEYGQLTGYSGYLLDVTARLESEAARRRFEADFRAVIDASTDGICIYREGRVVFVNAAAVRILRYPNADALLGRRMKELVHPRDWEAAAGRVRAVWDTGVPSTAKDLRLTCADGAQVTVEVVELLAGFGGAPAVVSLARDVTEQRQLAARAMQADRMVAVGTLATGVAHEINNPLSYVLANVDYVSQQLGAAQRLGSLAEVRTRLEDLGGALTDARKGAERVRDIVADLRMLARPDDDAVGTADVPAALDAALSVARREIQHRATLVRAYGDLPAVRGGPSKLGQVFLNLLLNAAQAIPEGAPEHHEVRVTGRADADHVYVEVRDTGTGIADADLPRIFDPFFTTKPMGQGTGLGLSICRGIVESFGGEISVTTARGVGTTFTVRLARHVEGGARVAPAPQPQVAPQRGRLLIVDDDPMVVSALRRMLSERFDLKLAHGGQEAVSIVEGGQVFDAVLCDLMMPQVTGMEVYQRVRRLDAELAARFVFMTAGAFTPEARGFLEAVPNTRVGKPFELEELTRALEPLISKPHTPAKG